ncbi:MAG: EamA family transporter [Myxococcales bacterium]|nr:EamA family transporter [Myxococcales bacterium]
MGALILASLVWAASFGLIKRTLVGVDPSLVALLRLAIALPVFAPWLRRAGLTRTLALALLAIGGVQYGAMYTLYIRAYAHLQGHEIALFTVLTPIYVLLVDGLWARRLPLRGLGLAALAVLGAALIEDRGEITDAAVGFALTQAANLCFAAGQVAYRRLRRQNPQLVDHQVFALLLAGAVAVAAVSTTGAGGWGDLATITGLQWATLLYLGVVATGLGFYLWNRGAVVVSAATLAVFNNLKVPLAVVVALFVFGEEADLLRLAIGGGLVLVAGCLAGRDGGRSVSGRRAREPG